MVEPALPRNWQHGWALTEEIAMEWRTPKLVEIACGCEINAYFPADL
jgi:coenzyme PQQ precursor peptide PqqA